MSEFESSSSGSVVTTTRGFEASDADGPTSACRAAVVQPPSVRPSSANENMRIDVIVAFRVSSLIVQAPAWRVR